MTVIAKRMKAWKSKIAPGKAYPIDEALGLVRDKRSKRRRDWWENACHVRSVRRSRRLRPGAG